MDFEECFKCSQRFTDSNPANPKLATSLLTCIKCGHINRGKSALQLHYKIHHSSPAPHTLCDACATSLGRTTERDFRMDNFSVMKKGNTNIQNVMQDPATVKKRFVQYMPKKSVIGSPSGGSATRYSASEPESGVGSGSRYSRRDGKDSRSSRYRQESLEGVSEKKKCCKFRKFFK